MKKLTIALALLFSSSVSADYCISWQAPTENTDGSALTDLAGYNLWCIPETSTYGSPEVLPQTQTSYKKIWPSPAGGWKCAVSAFNAAGIESTKAEIFFTLVDLNGDGNPEVLGTDGSCTYQPPVITPVPPELLEVN